MSQSIWSSINPNTTSGTMLAGLLTDFKDALMTGCAGTSRPPNLQAGGMWIDTTNQSAPDYQWSFKLYNGTTDMEVFRLSVLSGFGGTLYGDAEFDVEHIAAADAVAPILSLIKNRIDTNGQVLDGDTVAEIRFVGRTLTATDPTVGYLRWTSTDNETATAYGGTFSIYSTPDASSTITQHLQMLGGYVESVVAHKVNSQRFVPQNVATAATIVALNADYRVVEFTGATSTDLQGIDAAGKSQDLILHNRSTATVTLKHQNTSASAVNRLKLPKSQDIILTPDGCVTLYYCSTDTRWKLKSGRRAVLKTLTNVRGPLTTWTAPNGITEVNIVGMPRCRPLLDNNANKIAIDTYGNVYAWGLNTNGQLGLGDVTSRSSPVAVIGAVSGVRCIPIYDPSNAQSASAAFFLTKTGDLYACGTNGTFGGLGVGDVTPRSSPVAVLGSLKFTSGIYPVSSAAFGISETGILYAWGDSNGGASGWGDLNFRSSPVAVLGGIKFSRLTTSVSVPSTFGISNTGAAYAWGFNINGQLGVGDVTSRSSPVAVLGGLTFSKIVCGIGSASHSGAVIGLTTDGTLYAWGANEEGQLGLGDVTPRSSPVAVLGGLTFVDVFQNYLSTYALTSDGTLYAWGRNSKGELGVGDLVSRSSPVAVLGGLKFTSAVRPAGRGVLAITTNGDMYAWGIDTSGGLGVGDVTARSSPVAVLGGLKFEDVYYAGTGVGSDIQRALGVTTDGGLYSWGQNSSGESGQGNVTAHSSPVAVLGGFGMAPRIPVRTAVAVTPGQSYSVSLNTGTCYFGGTPIGVDFDSITIEYKQ